MKFIFIALLTFSAYANTKQQAANFVEILSAQGNALELMEEQDKSSSYKLVEMITDIGFTKSGILGVSAMKSNNGIEVKWKKSTPNSFLTPDDMLFADEDADENQIESLTNTIVGLVEKSGKVRPTRELPGTVRKALLEFQSHISDFHVTRFEGWRASGVRLDLNFSTSGELSFISKAGVAIRVRIEWTLKDKPLVNPDSTLLNDKTKFVSKVLNDLNRISATSAIPGFETMKVGVGVGASVKKDFFGMWKYSAGFLGTLFFVPVPRSASLVSLSLPKEVQEMALEVGGFEEELSDEKIWRPWRRRPKVNFATGMEKSFRTAAFFANQAANLNFKNWYVAELKTLNDITKTGIFGLANVTSRGLIEIDYKRIR